ATRTRRPPQRSSKADTLRYWIASPASPRHALNLERLTVQCRGTKLPETVGVRDGVHSREKTHEREAPLHAGDAIQSKLDVAHVGPSKRKSCAERWLSCTFRYAPDEDHVERHGFLRPNGIHAERLSTAPARRHARVSCSRHGERRLARKPGRAW